MAGTYEVMDERGNCMQRLRQRLTNRRQLLRERKISDDDFRLAEAIADDMELYRALASGGLLQRVPGTETYICLPGAKTASIAPVERCEDALQRLGDAHGALGAYKRKTAKATRADFDHWIGDDPTMHAFERRAKVRNGSGLDYVYWMLDKVGDAQIYDRQKWKVVIRGEAA